MSDGSAKCLISSKLAEIVRVMCRKILFQLRSVLT